MLVMTQCIARGLWPQSARAQICCRKVAAVVARVIHEKPSKSFVEVEIREMANPETLRNRRYMWLVARKSTLTMYHSSQTSIHGDVEMSQWCPSSHELSKICYTPRGDGSGCDIGRCK
jgi:hypothetical protein